MNKLDELINILVDKEIEILHSFGFYWCDKNNIWTTSIFTYQLQIRLEKTLKKLFGSDTKKVVKGIIKNTHLQIIKKYPELKEY